MRRKGLPLRETKMLTVFTPDGSGAPRGRRRLVGALDPQPRPGAPRRSFDRGGSALLAHGGGDSAVGPDHAPAEPRPVAAAVAGRQLHEPHELGGGEVGLAARISATRPATCGVAMLVPTR